MYDRLGVRFDVQLGESFYDPMLADVVKGLEDQGLAVPSEGATVVFVEGATAPFLVRKSDGAYNYATTDLATIKYRVDTWNPSQVLYVVDHRQGDHFKALFAVARRWGYDKIDLEHVAFGTVLGPDGRPLKTRDGDLVGLESMIDEAVSEARQEVDRNCPDLDQDERRHVAEIVGIGAIKYADLSQNRLSDYRFDLKKMVAMTGNTGAVHAICIRANPEHFSQGRDDAGSYPDHGRRNRPESPGGEGAGRGGTAPSRNAGTGGGERKPNILTDYLFDLANKFSVFFEGCPVLKAESPERRASRLAICDLTARTLKFGLNLLGIDVVERM